MTSEVSLPVDNSVTDHLVGFQKHENWMGNTYLTLADVWPESPKAMIVGLNPAPTSVAKGHYYQGARGKGQLNRLVGAGILPPPSVDGHYEESAVAAGLGFTDLVKRPTISEKQIFASDLAQGKAILAEKLKVHGVNLIVCVFRHPAVALLNAEERPGLQLARTSWGAQVFRLPGPSQSTETSTPILASLRELLAS